MKLREHEKNFTLSLKSAAVNPAYKTFWFPDSPNFITWYGMDQSIKTIGQRFIIFYQNADFFKAKMPIHFHFSPLFTPFPLSIIPAGNDIVDSPAKILVFKLISEDAKSVNFYVFYTLLSQPN